MITEIETIILKFLKDSDFGAVFISIKQFIIAEYPDLLPLTVNGERESDAFHKMLDTSILVSLDNLEKSRFISYSDSRAYTTNENHQSITVEYRKYGITKPGIVFLKHIEIKGWMKPMDYNNLSWAINHFSDYGINDLYVVEGILKEIDVNLDVQLTLYFLYRNGFCTVRNYAMASFELTDRGRELKKCGSYSRFIFLENDKHRNAEERVKLSDNILKLQENNAQWQYQINPILKAANKIAIKTNHNTVKTNRILIVVFSLTLMVSVFSLIVNMLSIFRDNKIDKLNRELELKDSLIQSQSRLLKVLSNKGQGS